VIAKFVDSRGAVAGATKRLIAGTRDRRVGARLSPGDTLDTAARRTRGVAAARCSPTARAQSERPAA
jgi:hypothetical protein